MKKLLVGITLLSSISVLANNDCSYQFKSKYDHVVRGCADIHMDDAFSIIKNKLGDKGYYYLPLDEGEANYTVNINYACTSYYTGIRFGDPSRVTVTLTNNSDNSKVIIEKSAFGLRRDRRSLKKALGKISNCN
ncbi:MAG: hypothetical protein N4A33_08515 [Bacteriovoracaceae bacterium]|jgi:hypothetical protein|nr:hypothetical protein [Bacteriovoracaceae bacterium]